MRKALHVLHETFEEQLSLNILLQQILNMNLKCNLKKKNKY